MDCLNRIGYKLDWNWVGLDWIGIIKETSWNTGLVLFFVDIDTWLGKLVELGVSWAYSFARIEYKFYRFSRVSNVFNSYQ